MMKIELEMLKEFHEKFGAPINYKLTYPVDMKYEDKRVRYTMIAEEVEELGHAIECNDLIEIADAIGDILYLAFGTAHTFGIADKIQEVFAEIHKSNMSKLGEDGKPILRDDGKILKGPNYFRPSIDKILLG